MSIKLYLLICVSVSIVYLQDIISPSNPKCNTINVKEKGDFKVVGIDKDLPSECVNNLALEKNGQKYCISEGDDELQCKCKNKILL